MQVWTFLHIVAMFAAVSLVIGGSVFALEAGRRRDVAALKAYFRLAGSLERMSTFALFAGIAFGLLAAVAGGIDLLRGWLVLAYVLVAAGFVLGLATAPRPRRCGADRCHLRRATPRRGRPPGDLRRPRDNGRWRGGPAIVAAVAAAP